MANRPFADGALFDRTRGKELPSWAGEIGCASWAQFFLRFAASHPAVTCAIPGAKRPDQVEQNARAADLPELDPTTMAALRELYDTRLRELVHQRW